MTPSPKRTGVILVHGIGNQKRYEFTKLFGSELYQAIRERHPEAELRIDRVELCAMPARTLETSDLFSFFGAARPPGAQGRETLFRPVTIVDGEHSISIYEAYWADEDLEFNWFEKLKFNLWLTTTIWNPLFNFTTGRYKARPVTLPKLLRYWFSLVFLDFVIHMAESILVLVAFVARKTEPLRRFGDIIFEYAGDVKLYYSQRLYFHNQTKQQVLLARFDEVLLKANLDGCEAIHIVGHSLGSVLAYDGLHQHRVEPTKMSLDFLEFVREKAATPVTVQPFKTLRTFISLASPLDKTYLVFASARPTQLQDAIRLSVDQGPGAGIVRATPENRVAPEFEWHNINDVSDPLGDRLAWYDKAQSDDFPAPQNRRLARAWWPHTAHSGLWKDRQVMNRIAARILGEYGELGESRLGDRTVHSLWLLVVASLSFGVLCFGFHWMLDLALGTLHDMYADAESLTIFSKMELIDTLIFRVRDWLDLTRGPETRWLLRPVVVTVTVFVWFALVALIPAALRYRTVERIREMRKPGAPAEAEIP